MKLKILLVVFLIFSVCRGSGQGDSLFIDVKKEINSSIPHQILLLKIDFISQKRSQVKVQAKTSLSEFKCNFNAGVWMVFEVLNGTCFEERGPDCAIPMDGMFEREKRELRFGDSISYSFDITSYITRRKNGELTGVYRFKVFHSYNLSANWLQKSTDWIYLNIDSSSE